MDSERAKIERLTWANKKTSGRKTDCKYQAHQWQNKSLNQRQDLVVCSKEKETY